MDWIISCNEHSERGTYILGKGKIIVQKYWIENSFEDMGSLCNNIDEFSIDLMNPYHLNIQKHLRFERNNCTILQAYPIRDSGLFLLYSQNKITPIHWRKQKTNFFGNTSLSFINAFHSHAYCNSSTIFICRITGPKRSSQIHICLFGPRFWWCSEACTQKQCIAFAY